LFIHLAAVDILLENSLLLTAPVEIILLYLKHGCLYEHYLPATLRSREIVIKVKKVLQEKVTAVTVLIFFSQTEITLFT
jgi:hypothetical protein